MPETPYLRALDDEGWDSGLNTVGVRVGRWKLVRYATGEHELYDLRTDPLEMESIRGPAGGVRDLMQQVWEQYAACSGADCVVPLPEALRLGPRATARLTRAQHRAERAYYGR